MSAKAQLKSSKISDLEGNDIKDSSKRKSEVVNESYMLHSDNTASFDNRAA